MNIKTVTSHPEKINQQEFPPDDVEREIRERSLRLKAAVKQAGGNLAVAQKSGVNLGTLNGYIAGRDMKAAYMVALARGCGVSVEWLATGEGPMQPGAAPAQEKPQISAPVPALGVPAPPKLEAFGTLDVERMGLAVETARTLIERTGGTADGRKLGQLVLLIYDQLGPPRDA